MKRNNRIILLFAILYSLCTILGISFLVDDSFSSIQKYPVLFSVGFLCLIFLFDRLLIRLLHAVDQPHEWKWFHRQHGHLYRKFKAQLEEHPMRTTIVSLSVTWLIYIIAFYPGIVSPDPTYEIVQFFQIPNKYSSYVNLIDPHQLLTSHHPVLHAVFIGSCVKLGLLLFHSTNIGLFIYTIVQTSVLMGTLAYTIKFMKEIGTSYRFRFLTLLCYCFVPVFPFYAVTDVKDVFYTCYVILFEIMVFRLVTQKIQWNWKRILSMIGLMILVCLARKNGIYVVAITLFVLLLSRVHRKQVMLLLVCIVSFYTIYNQAILPYFHITPGSPREMLSIPFQQTARYTKYYGDEMSADERKSIDRVLDLSDLAQRYNPERADPVKNKYNPDTTTQDLKNYFKTWAYEFTKHPLVYFEATIANTYGYYSPLKYRPYVYFRDRYILNQFGFDYQHNSLANLRAVLRAYGNSFVWILPFGLLINIGFNTWIVGFMVLYYICRKKYKAILCLVPAFVTFLVCLASPVNAYFRYIMPNVFSLYILAAMFHYFQKKRKDPA